MIKHLTGPQVAANSNLLKALIELDRLNMEPILQASGFNEFPLEKRLAYLKKESTQFFGFFEDEILVGYIEACRDSKDPQDIYLSSIQIMPTHQGFAIFKSLITAASTWIMLQDFRFLTSNVQIANTSMLKIFKQLGFEISEGAHPCTKLIHADFAKIKQTELFKRLVR